jgi:flagellar motor protein MotB
MLGLQRDSAWPAAAAGRCAAVAMVFPIGTAEPPPRPWAIKLPPAYKTKATPIDVTGHADRAGGDAYNMALSLRRANMVKDQLVREGIAANQITVVGRGESQPLLPTADGVREPQNRRVEIVLG